MAEGKEEVDGKDERVDGMDQEEARPWMAGTKAEGG